LLGFFQFVAFPGQAFLQHFLGYNLLSFSATRLASGALIFGIMFLVPLLVGFEFLRVYPDTFLRCYLGCAAVLALLAMGRQGSDTNYFLECALIVSPLFAALLAKRIAEPARAAELLALLAVTLLVGQLFAPDPPLREDIDRDRAVQDYLRHNFSPGTRALSYYTGDLMRAGLEIPISNLFHYVWLIRKGTFSEQALVDQLRDRRFPAIVVNYDLQTPTGPDKLEVFLTEGIRQAILANYQLATSLEAPRPERIREGARFDVWVPRSEVSPVASPERGPTEP